MLQFQQRILIFFITTMSETLTVDEVTGLYNISFLPFELYFMICVSLLRNSNIGIGFPSRGLQLFQNKLI